MTDEFEADIDPSEGAEWAAEMPLECDEIDPENRPVSAAEMAEFAADLNQYYADLEAQEELKS
jgi:hypothetical protein